MAKNLSSALESTLKLSEQFCVSLSSPRADSQPRDIKPDDPSPLPLLNASAQLLKSQTTKLSLLAINSPFTPSAVVTVLSAVNENVLPSLVTAAHLTDPSIYTDIFHSEVKQLVKETLRETSALVNEVKFIAAKNGKGLRGTEKNTVTITTGRVWEACDKIIAVAERGVLFLLAEKLKRSYHPLITDAILELKEWEPGEEDEEDIFGEDLDDWKKEDEGEEKEENDDEEDFTELHDEKKHVLRLLKPIADLYIALASRFNRIKLNIPPRDQVKHIDRTVSLLFDIPNRIDEVVGSLYEHDIEETRSHTRSLKEAAVKVVQLARQPWSGQVNANAERQSDKTDEEKTLEEKFARWADTWLKVFEGISASGPGAAVPNSNG